MKNLLWDLSTLSDRKISRFFRLNRRRPQSVCNRPDSPSDGMACSYTLPCFATPLSSSFLVSFLTFPIVVFVIKLKNTFQLCIRNLKHVFFFYRCLMPLAKHTHEPASDEQTAESPWTRRGFLIFSFRFILQQYYFFATFISHWLSFLSLCFPLFLYCYNIKIFFFIHWFCCISHTFLNHCNPLFVFYYFYWSNKRGKK